MAFACNPCSARKRLGSHPSLIDPLAEPYVSSRDRAQHQNGLSAIGGCNHEPERRDRCRVRCADFPTREAGFVIGGLGIGGLLYAFVVPLILRFASRPAMMAAGGGVAALGLGGVGLAVPWGAQMALMVVLGFGFFLLHNSVQTEVTELAPSARASAFSLHAFSFFMGQALGPMV